MLAKSPGFTAVVLVTLALGIGANTCIFSVLNAVAWRNWPGVSDPQHLVWLRTHRLFGSVSYPDYLDYQQENTVFSGLVISRSASLNWRGVDGAERLTGAIVSENFFSILGVKPVLGRTFLPGEKTPVAVVSYSFWRRRFGSNPELLGRPLLLNGQAYSVVGVTPKDFNLTDWAVPIDVWVPIPMQPLVMPDRPKLLDERGSDWFAVIGRLKSGRTLEQAQAEIRTISVHLDQAYHNDQNWRVDVKPATGLATLDRNDMSFFGLLFVVAGLVLLIACANVANLLLARASARRGEIAVRLAVGADRSRLIRQLLTESVLLSLLGAVVGLLLAFWSSRLVLLLLPTGWTLDVAPDSRVLLFTLILSILTAVIFGLAPALQASRLDLLPILKGEASTAPRRHGSASRSLVIFQVALSMVLLVGSGLFLKTLRNYQGTELGFQSDRLLLLSVDLGTRGYSPDQGRLFYHQLLDRAASVPGVESASVAQTIPIGAHNSTRIQREGHESHSDKFPLEVDSNIVGPSYFATMQIPFLQGREFTSLDGVGAPGVAIINETMARSFWPGEIALGRRLRLAGMGIGPWLQIIGVAGDSKFRGLDQKPLPLLYLPIGQHYRPEMVLHVRASQPKSLIGTLRREVNALDANLPVYAAGTFAEHLDAELLDQRIIATLVSVFAAAAMFLASIGLYGVISQAVGQRTREIGVRMALGAESRDILKLVLGMGLTLTFAGIGIGAAAALALARLTASRLYGVSTTDPASILTAAMLLAVVASGASYIPARRVASSDPVAALRRE
ncbi:MAG: ABC transporter permease [Acidobacteriia bacterium]|nr:ABC transporter permease [Terriglobia bacterium]